MTPWWDNTTGTLIGAIGGSALGVVTGLYGAAAGVLLPKGLAKTPMLALHFVLITIGVVSLIAGIAALIARQPYAVWYPLTLIGFIGTVVMGSLLPVTILGYRRAEQRKMDAAALRRS